MLCCPKRSIRLQHRSGLWAETDNRTGVSLMMLMASWFAMTSHSPSEAIIKTSSSEVKTSSRTSGVETCMHDVLSCSLICLNGPDT